MRVRILAVGTKLPRWAQDACSEYLERLKPALDVTLVELEAGKRSASGDTTRAIAQEAARFEAALGRRDYLVALDEKGVQRSTRELASWLQGRIMEARDLNLLIGGPDGLPPDLRRRCNEALSLSKLTLPHALARVVLAEQLYRAQSVLAGHPYHRE